MVNQIYNKSPLAVRHQTAAQHSVHPIPGKVRRGHGGGTLRGAFSGSLRGLKRVPSKRRYLVPPTSTPEGAYPLREDHPSGALHRRKPFGGNFTNLYQSENEVEP
jgi:hypothetical protein